MQVTGRRSQNWCVRRGSSILASIVIVASLGCADEPIDARQVTGCYESTIGPFLLNEYPEHEPPPVWIALDSTAAARASVSPAFSVSSESQIEERSIWQAWWQPVGPDSIVVMWEADGPSLEYRLHVHQDRLEGEAIFHVDVSDVEPRAPVGITAARTEC